MTEAFKTIPPGAGRPPVRVAPKSPQKPKLLQSPGIVAISLYMLLLAVAVVIDVAKNPSQRLLLVFAVLFIAAGLGLLKLLRWAWTLTLAAVAMLAGLFLWNYTNQHLLVPLAYGLLNLIIFLYLVRTEIRNKFH
jgi:hypothetical protein